MNNPKRDSAQEMAEVSKLGDAVVSSEHGLASNSSALDEIPADLEKRPLVVAHKRTAGYPSGIINLLKTTVGSGMLSLPYAIAIVGLLPAVVMMVVACVCAVFGLQLLIYGARASETDGVASFTNLAKITYPRVGVMLDVAIILQCVGVGINYLSVVAGLIPRLIIGLAGAGKAGALLESMHFWLVIVLVGIAPVTFMRRMDSLKYTSSLGLASIAYMVVLSIYTFFTNINSADGFTGFARLSFFRPFTLQFFQAFPVFIFAYCCHPSIFPIYNESKNNSNKAMFTIVSVTMTISSIIYSIFSFFSYASFGEGTDSNILQNYPTNGGGFILARFLYAFLLIFSYPLQTFPCRVSVQTMVAYYAPEKAKMHEKKIYWIASVGILLITGGVAALQIPMANILALVGSTASPVICYFLPAIYYYKLSENNPGDRTRKGAIALFIFGCLVVAVCMTATIAFWK